MPDELPSRVIASIAFVGRSGGQVKALAGFNKRHHPLPDAANATTNAFLGKICDRQLTEEAERLFRRAIDLNPRNSQTHLWFTNLLIIQERFDEAENGARTARILDPHSKIAIALVGWRPYWQGDLEEPVGS